jgi:hypothetical protein
MFSYRDWGVFPRYWFHPIKIGIFQTNTSDIAVSFGDLAKAKEDRMRTIQWNGRIEESQFPNLNYEEWPMFNVPSGTHHSMMKGGTLSVGNHPVIVLGQGVEFKLMNIRVEACVRGYPREREFIWFFTDPCRTYLVSQERAEEEALHDFWDTIGSIVFTKLDSIAGRKLNSDIVSILLDSVNRLQKEYHSLITLEDIEEQRLQNFLENHFFLIDPNQSYTKEKRQLGPYYPDFVLRYADGNITFVEIQRNNDPFIENGALSKGLKEAIGQLRSWFEWISANQPALFSKCSGLIIIGRRPDYEKNKKLIEKALSNMLRPVRLVTYNDLEGSFDYVKSMLKTM